MMLNLSLKAIYSIFNTIISQHNVNIVIELFFLEIVDLMNRLDALTNYHTALFNTDS